ncbi:MAG TPA: hypothetical protein VGZ89_13500 [Xanthobacteraceae bacterium]|nr:hypothetical protein [Xanthobacteraceae bacterium]
MAFRWKRAPDRWKHAPDGFDSRAKRSGPVALALKVAKRGRAQANTQKTSAFFGAVNLIRYHAGPDKLGQDTFFRVKVTARDVSPTPDQEELGVSHSLHFV